MHQRHHVPTRLLPAWRVLAFRYGEYLPEIVMERDSFMATREAATALFQELEEIAQYAGLPLDRAQSCM
jgi:hypothetical protein